MVDGGSYYPDLQAVIDKRRAEVMVQRDTEREKPMCYSWYGTTRGMRLRIAFLQRSSL